MTILCYGEIGLDIYLAIDRLPRLNQAADCTEEFENVGGAAANSALWLANWGLPTRLAGHDLGDDRAGAAVRQAFRAHPLLDAAYVACHPGYRTPRCQCLVTPDGERSFIMHWLDELRMTAPTPEMFAGLSWLNLDMSGPRPSRLRAAELAAERAVSVLVNDIYDQDDPLLPLVDVLVISASIICSRHPAADPLDLARELQAAAGCHVILTDSGADITVLTNQSQVHKIAPPRVDAVDTTGAGDIFKSGLLYGLGRGLPLAQAARWGAAAGSLMCQYAGTTKTLAPLNAVEDLLATMA